MILKFNTSHKSVNSFADVNIDDFAVLTGKNGSGKTHIIEAIKLGYIGVSGVNIDQILHLNYLDFAYDFQKVATTEKSSKLEAWNQFNNQNQNDVVAQIRNLDNEIQQYKKVFEEVADKKGKAIFDLKPEDLENPNMTGLYDLLANYIKTVSETFDKPNYTNSEIALSVYDSIICKSKKFITSLSKNEFIDMYEKSAIGTRNILTDLSTVFLEYHRKTDKNQLNKLKGKSYLDENQFKKEHGEPPWNLVKNILKKFDLGFEINDPDSEDVDSFDGFFSIKFINTKRKNKEVPFTDLSSGEKILITLVNAVYTSFKKGKLPKLILLDEIDGPLNPSIIEKFIEFLNESFVQKGIKVILATHSPSTIAFAPENSIYLVDTSDAFPIKNTTKVEGISKLSEGFVTLEDLLHLRTIKADTVIISEGKNHSFIEKAKTYFAPNADIEIVKLGSIGNSGLRILFEFLRVFNNEKKIIYVWDFDYRFEEKMGVVSARNFDDFKKLVNKNNLAYVFDRNGKSEINSGIENLFDKTVTDDYPEIITDGKVNNKDHFRDFILRRSKEEDFANFEVLFKFIESEQTSNL